MTPLFRRLQPAQKIRISITCIAQLLKIPKHLIVRVESWAYVVFVHRQDKGGQFISDRQLQQWRNAVAYQIQNCSTCQQLHSLWLAIEGDSEALLRLRSMVRKQQSADRKKHNKQYDDQHYPFLFKIWAKRARTLWKEQELSGKPLILHDYYRNSQELA